MISSSAVPKFDFRSARMPQDLRLDDHVERRRRLVGDEQLRPQHERERDHDPLPHAARELVRVLAEARRRDPHPAERLERPPPHLCVLQLRLVALERLGEVILDPQQRVEARHRLLEDQPEVGPAQPAELPAAASRSGSGRRTSPRRRAAAPSGRSPRMPRPSVDLPQPDSPTSPTISPSSMSSDTPSTARTGPRPVP